MWGAAACQAVRRLRLTALSPTSAGCAVMERVLNTAVPRFLQQLEADYIVWASGADEREPVAEG